MRRLAFVALMACGSPPAPTAPTRPSSGPTREACEAAIRAAMRTKGGSFDALDEADRAQMVDDCQRDGRP